MEIELYFFFSANAVFPMPDPVRLLESEPRAALIVQYPWKVEADMFEAANSRVSFYMTITYIIFI